MMRIVVLEKTLESLLACKEIKPVNPKGSQSWIFIGRTGAEAEAPILWPPDGKNWLTGKEPDGGKDWRREEKGMTEDEMVGWHHRLNGHEFELALGVGDGQGRLSCCNPWGCKELDKTERLNWNNLMYIGYLAWQHAGHVVRASQMATIAINLILQLLKMDGNIAWSPRMPLCPGWSSPQTRTFAWVSVTKNNLHHH